MGEEGSRRGKRVKRVARVEQRFKILFHAGAGSTEDLQSSMVGGDGYRSLSDGCGCTDKLRLL